MEYLVVDVDNRQINIPESIAHLGVKDDNETRTLNFRMPKIYKGLDMSGYTIEINYINAKGKADSALAGNIQVGDEEITFQWCAGGTAYAKDGKVRFLVYTYLENEDLTKTNEWHTTWAALEVLDGGNVEEQIAEENPRIIEEMLRRIRELENGETGGTKDAVQYVEQELTDEQKTQARVNIGAVSEEEVSAKVKQAISEQSHFRFVKVDALPDIGEENVIYLVLGEQEEENIYEEYLFVDGVPELIGSAQIDLSGYAPKATTLAGYGITDGATKGELGQVQEEIDDLKENGTGTIVSSVEPATDDIPKVFFDKPIPQTKDDVVTKFRYISKTQDIEGYAKFKAQGNSSMNYKKKNMTVKLYKDEALEEKMKVDFKGWGEQRKFCLKANWIDLTHARNVVSARIWADMVRSRSSFEELPELYRTSPNLGAIDGFPIKVYSQGIYQGRYTWNIPKDAWMFNMDDSLDEHCVLCSEDYGSSCFRKEAKINGGDWSDEIHDTVPDSILTRWNEIISFVMNATNEDFKANIGNYMDVASLIDYWIYAYVSCGLDCLGKNQIYLTYDGQYWYASMYDMDSTWGLYWTGTSFVSPTYRMQEDYEVGKVGTSHLLYDLLAINFTDEIKARYLELRNSVLSVPNIINHFERFTDICPTELVKEDYATTTGSGKFTTIPSQTTNNIQQIRQFVIDRLAYVDSMIVVTLSSISATYTGGSVLVGTELSELDGIVVTANYSNGTTETITDYELSGLIEEGLNTITVTYSDMTTTITVNGHLEGQEPKELVSISATYNGGDVVEGTKVSALTGVTVTGTYSDGSTAEITDYTLSGVIGVGENTITVTCENKTTTFTVIGTKDDTLLYLLPQEKTFNGTSDYIDTGVQLFDAERDLSIYLDFTCITNTTGAGTTAILCADKDTTYGGLTITENRGSDNSHYMKYEGVKIGEFGGTNNPLYENRHTVIYTLDTTTKTESIYLDGKVLQSKTYTTFNVDKSNLLLGCRNISGTNEWFWCGIMHDCRVFNHALSAEQIASLSK